MEGAYNEKLSGRFYLEVKNWPGDISKALGSRGLKKQLNNHFDRALKNGDFPGTDVSEWTGLLYRFSKAGPDNGNFKAYRAALRAQAAESVRKILENPANELTKKQIREKVKEFMENKFVIELVDGAP